FTETAPFPVTLRVSAAFRGAVTRLFSPVATLNVSGGAKTAIQIIEPSNLSSTNNAPITVRGTVSDSAATVTVNGVVAAVGAGGFSVAVPLIEGNNTITAVATANGVSQTASLQVTLDTTPPRVTLISPPNGFATIADTISIAGTVNDTVVGTVNDQQA